LVLRVHITNRKG